MAKQIIRYSPVIALLAIVSFLLVVPFVQSDPPDPPEGDPTLAFVVRRPLGFGPSDVIPAYAGDDNHRQMISLARTFVANHEEELATLVENLRNARRDLIRALTWGEDPGPARQALREARLAIIQALTDLLPELRDRIPVQYRPLVARVLQNRRLDHDLRALNLTSQQREDILSAQHVRDSILRNARNWYEEVLNEEARAEFETALQSILTEPQRTQLAAIRQTIEDRKIEMMTAELEQFGES